MSEILSSLLGQTPDFIIGKWDTNRLTPASKEAYGESYGALLGKVQINKYEFWFKDTISFIPYDGQPVFIADTLGNVTHTGNLLTKGNAIIEKKLTVKDDTTLEKKLVVKDDVTFEKTMTVADKSSFKQDVSMVENLNVDNNVRIKKDLFVTGNITAANLGQLQSLVSSAVNSIGGVTTAVEELKTTVNNLKNEVDKMKKQIADLQAAAAE